MFLPRLALLPLLLLSLNSQAEILPDTKPAVLGPYPADDFRITNGHCGDCPAPRQGLWYFQQDAIAVPLASKPLSGFNKTLPLADEAKAALAARQPNLPSLILLGGPDLLPAAQFAPGYTVKNGDSSAKWRLTAKLASNRSWYDSHSAAFFGTQPLKLRGTWKNGKQLFEVRSMWPRGFTINENQPLQALSKDETVQGLIQADHGGARQPFSSRLLWRKNAQPQPMTGKAVLGIMLNGAQGDDDEAHGGHVAIATGRMGSQGDISDLLISNFYSLDIYSEKGIVAAVTPLDNYLGDLNSGQLWYRPSYMMVAVLGNDWPATVTQDALNRVMNRFYRHDVVYNHSQLNCTGLSMDTLRNLGWQVPMAGNSGKLMASLGFAFSAASSLSLESGKETYRYMNAEMTRLLPAVAFREASTDMLQLAQQQTARKLSTFEQRLASQIEAVYFVRIPQYPSSRKWGQAPVFSNTEYSKRTPFSKSDWQIVPVDKRPFPASLRD